jgi:hypothetical protein
MGYFCFANINIGVVMQNLAGHWNSTAIVKVELTRCGIPVKTINEKYDGGEVGAKVYGELGQFHFYRAWRYYIVNGRLPLNVAEKLYEHPVGRTDIRVNGHCGCPPPKEQAVVFDDNGIQLISKQCIDEIYQAINCVNENSYFQKQHYEAMLENIRCIDEVPEQLRCAYIDLYHT